MDVVVTDEEIDRVENWANAGISKGGRYRGMSYEEGIRDTLMWLRGDSIHPPDEE